jgi:hypothetical protein
MAPTSKYAFGPSGEEYRCAVPANTPICQALLNKAAAYPPEKKYNRDATLQAARRVEALRFSIPALNWVGQWTPRELKEDFSYGMIRHMRDLVENPPPVKCRHADNQPIYQALVEKAASYPPEKKWQGVAYATAAAAVAAMTESLKENHYAAESCLGVGDATGDFIVETAERIFCPTTCLENKALYNYLSMFGSDQPADARALAAVAQHPTQLTLDAFGTLAVYLPGLTRETRQRIEDFLPHPRMYY